MTGAQEVGLRGRRFSTEADIERHISNGFGRGTGASYKPWLRVQDVPSTGHSRKVSGVKIERTFHLLSNLEYGYFLVSEFSEDVVDIREQYPLLPRGTAQSIASSLGVRYPIYPKSSVPVVMTTDFVLTVKSPDGSLKTVARSTKYSKDLEDNRTVDKLEVEREFWVGQGVSWEIVTEQYFTNDLVNNISLLRKYSQVAKPLKKESLTNNFLYFLTHCDDRAWTLRQALLKVSSKLHIPYSDAKALYMHLAWTKRIAFDLAAAPIQTGLPLPKLTINDQPSTVVSAVREAI